MSKLGFRTMDEMVGRVDCIEMRPAVEHWKARGLDYSSILYNPPLPRRVGRRCLIAQDHGLEQALDYELIKLAKEALDQGGQVECRMPIRNSGATAVIEGVGDQGCEYMTKGLVVVLGRTGRNFAAGMTGGIAFVLDETGEFASVQCNKAGVDLEPVTDPADMQALQNLIAKHVETTGSPRGQWILENWGRLLPKFVKVFPHEYKRVLGIPRLQAVAKVSDAPAQRVPRQPVPLHGEVAPG